MTDAAADVKKAETDRKAADDKRKKREEQETLTDAMQAEEEANKVAAKLVPPPTTKPGAVAKPPQALPRDRKDARSAHGDHVIETEHLEPEDALAPHFLYALVAAKRLMKHDRVLMKDKAFRWEYTARIMRIDVELQTVQQSLIGEISRHDITQAFAMDLGACTTEYRGTVLKWVVAYGPANLKTGLDTQEEAIEWLERRKAVAVRKAA